MGLITEGATSIWVKLLLLFRRTKWSFFCNMGWLQRSSKSAVNLLYKTFLLFGRLHIAQLRKLIVGTKLHFQEISLFCKRFFTICLKRFGIWIRNYIIIYLEFEYTLLNAVHFFVLFLGIQKCLFLLSFSYTVKQISVIILHQANTFYFPKLFDALWTQKKKEFFGKTPPKIPSPLLKKKKKKRN